MGLTRCSAAHGETQAFVPALEASVAWKQFDFYIEAEYVRDSNQRDDSYFYAWSELGVRPVEWLRVGIAGQRTTTYGNDREFHAAHSRRYVAARYRRRVLVQSGIGRQIVVSMIGVTF